MGVIVELGENILYDISVLLVLLDVPPFADDLMRVFEFLEILVRRKVIGFQLTGLHDYMLCYINIKMNKASKYGSIICQGSRKRQLPA